MSERERERVTGPCRGAVAGRTSQGGKAAGSSCVVVVVVVLQLRWKNPGV